MLSVVLFCFSKCLHAECRLLGVVMLGVVMLGVVMLSVVMLGVVILSVVMLGVVAPSGLVKNDITTLRFSQN